MFAAIRTFGVSFLLAFCASFFLVLSINYFVAPRAIAEDDVVWRISKSSGDVWVTTSEVQQASLTDEAILQPGANIRTGQTGRALLVRGKESILISPNSIISIPRETKKGLPTTIIQQAGSILLDVEKRNVKHFEVETPYLAALVKGTQFRVAINKDDTRVDVLRGQVEVSDFKSGQYALVQPGQAGTVSAEGPGGLTLSGSGTLNPIQQGTPRRSSVSPALVPKEGLSASDGALKWRQVRSAPPLGEGEWISTSSAETSVNEDSWTLSPVTSSKGAGNADGWRTRNNTDGFDFTIALSVGLGVFVTVAAIRRKQKQRDRQS